MNRTPPPERALAAGIGARHSHAVHCWPGRSDGRVVTRWPEYRLRLGAARLRRGIHQVCGRRRREAAASIRPATRIPGCRRTGLATSCCSAKTAGTSTSTRYRCGVTIANSFRSFVPEYSERDAQFSPDMNWIAYESNKSGQSEIYMTRFPGAGREFPSPRAAAPRSGGIRHQNELFYVALTAN